MREDDVLALLMEKPVWNRELLDELGQAMRDASICGLGQAASNPLTSVIKYFRKNSCHEHFPAKCEAVCREKMLTFKVLRVFLSQNRYPLLRNTRKGSCGMTKIQFELDGKQVEAINGETIWQVAKRQAARFRIFAIRPNRTIGLTAIAGPAWSRVEGERVLAASCKRTPSVGMKVKTASARAVAAQKMVMELLVADQPARETSHDPDSKFLALGREGRSHRKPLPAAERWDGDASHPAMRVNLDSCIQCGLCVRA